MDWIGILFPVLRDIQEINRECDFDHYCPDDKEYVEIMQRLEKILTVK